jgi:lipoate-protein ligase A
MLSIFAEHYFWTVLKRLRIVRDTPHPPAFNMAADLYLMELAARSPGTVVLRLYCWKNPTVTIGCLQNAARDLDLDALVRDSVSWIKRPSGGRAVLHDGDITYSVAFAPPQHAIGTTVSQTYRIVAECLIKGLARAGIRSAVHDSKLDTALVRSQSKLPCFLAPNRHEIMIDGRKLVGSAQKRTQHAVLQHGSVPLSPGFRDLPRYSRTPPERRAVEAKLFEQKCVCVDELKPGLDRGVLGRSLAAGFASVLGLDAAQQPWTDSEQEHIASIAASDGFIRRYCT